MSFDGFSTSKQQHSFWTCLSNQTCILLNAGFIARPLPPLLIHTVRHYGSLVKYSNSAQFLDMIFINCFCILVETRVFEKLEQRETLLNRGPNIRLRTQQVRGSILTLVAHFGARMNVETHIIKTEIRSFLVKLPSKSNFPMKGKQKGLIIYEYNSYIHFIIQRNALQPPGFWLTQRTRLLPNSEDHKQNIVWGLKTLIFAFCLAVWPTWNSERKWLKAFLEHVPC